MCNIKYCKFFQSSMSGLRTRVEKKEISVRVSGLPLFPQNKFLAISTWNLYLFSSSNFSAPGLMSNKWSATRLVTSPSSFSGKNSMLAFE